MQKFGVNRLVYSSTCATYGNPKKLPITEKTPTLPINPYGKAKLYAEVAIRDFMHANPVGLGRFRSPRHRMPSTSTLLFNSGCRFTQDAD